MEGMSAAIGVLYYYTLLCIVGNKRSFSGMSLEPFRSCTFCRPFLNVKALGSSSSSSWLDPIFFFLFSHPPDIYIYMKGSGRKQC